MSIENFKPTYWSQLILASLQANLVASSLVNNDYEGEVSSSGDTVKIHTPDDVPVEDYTGSVTYKSPTAATQELKIDQEKGIAMEFEDVDQLQSNIDLVNTYTSKWGYSFAESLDKAIFGKYNKADSSNQITKALTADNIYKTLVNAATNLSENNVPENGRWVVLSPGLYGLLQQSKHFVHASNLGDSVLQTGVVGQAAGFTVLKSNNIAESGSSTVYEYPVYGYNGAITLAEQLMKTEALRDPQAFTDNIRALHVYGMKVVRPKGLGYIKSKKS